MNFDFQSHRVHDYIGLKKRWEALCRKSRLELKVFATVEGYDLIYAASPALRETGGIYLSAGIHGDEPAGTEALYLWAQLYSQELRKLPLLLFPCLNPWGLVHNLRTDSEGRDLNRSFQLAELERIRAHREIIDNRWFKLALCLHEDYDAQGVYLYELHGNRSLLGPELLSAAGFYVPIDSRRTIEGRRAKEGLIGRRKFPKFKELPEALYLAQTKSERIITLETPSEYDLGARVQAQIAAIQRAIELVQVQERSARISGSDF
jgi:murein peptide amidase A